MNFYGHVMNDDPRSWGLWRHRISGPAFLHPTFFLDGKKREREREPVVWHSRHAETSSLSAIKIFFFFQNKKKMKNYFSVRLSYGVFYLKIFLVFQLSRPSCYLWWQKIDKSFLNYIWFVIIQILDFLIVLKMMQFVVVVIFFLEKNRCDLEYHQLLVEWVSCHAPDDLLLALLLLFPQRPSS